VTVRKEAAVPVIAQADVLVVESTFSGCVAAAEVARQGRKVALVSSSTSLPRELVVALRPWVREADLKALPEALAALFEACVKERTADGEGILHAGKLAEAFEDMLLDAGVQILYDLRPCGALIDGHRAAGAVFAGKAGLVAVGARAVVDCTPDARLAALAGARLADRPAPSGIQVGYSMLCAAQPPASELHLDEPANLVDGKVLVHGPFAEFRIRLALSPDATFRDAELTLKTRLAVAQIGQALRESRAWAGAGFVRGGDALLVAPTRRIAARPHGQEIELAACQPEGVEALLVCSPAIDVDDAAAAALADPFASTAIARLVAAADWTTLCADAPRPEDARVVLTTQPRQDMEAGIEARFGHEEPIRSTLAELPLGQPALPLVAECDVLVVGGGTSGLPAALVAAQNGAKTLLIEKHADLGGTHTIGGVSKYWFGRTTDFVRRLDRSALSTASQSGMPKCVAMLYPAVLSGAGVLPQCLAVGALAEADRVRGAVVVTPTGLAAIRAKIVVDATGDGDVAVRAGAEASWGTTRDAMTLWFSFGHFKGTRPEASRHYHSVVDLRDAIDFSRAIIASRRRNGVFGRGDFPQYYLTPRESRHVHGRATVTYADILSGRRYPDTVTVCRSNFDIKGLAASDLALCGYTELEFRRNYSAPIPLRALLPERLDHILVVGKAYSITHDALSLARMQRDLMALGGAAGLAAALAARDGKPPADVDVADLQRRLVRIGILTPADLAEPPDDGPDVPALVRQWAEGRLPLTGQVAVLARGERAVPLLRDALAKAAPQGKPALARALCFLGNRDGVPVLLDELRRQLAADPLPRSPQKAHQAPDHGYAPEPAFLINAIGIARDPRVIPLLAPLATRIRMNPRRSDDTFHYVFAIAYAAERIADPAALPALEILADKPAIGGAILPPGTDPRKTADVVPGRLAYLELCVARAMARCGSPRGYRRLIDALGAPRGFIARSARIELIDLAATDCGPDPRKWTAWLAEAPTPLPPKPFTRRIE